MFRVRQRLPPGSLGYVLSVVPLLLLVLVYFFVSHQRLKENPKDPYLPGLKQFGQGWTYVTKLRTGSFVPYTAKEGDTAESIATAVGHPSFAEYVRTEEGPIGDDAVLSAGTEVEAPTRERYLPDDLKASLTRLFLGMSIGIALSLTFGLAMGVFTPVEKALYPIVAALAKIPPLALLPIIFIFQGVEELPKITIIALGIAPTMTMDILLRVKEIATEMITKAYTLGASTHEVVFKVVLPQIWPGFLNTIRLALGPAWVFLIAAEAISAEAGLGYRIFVVQRQLGMNIILIYIVIIMLIGLIIDWAIRAFITWRYKWAEIK